MTFILMCIQTVDVASHSQKPNCPSLKIIECREKKEEDIE